MEDNSWYAQNPQTNPSAGPGGKKNKNGSGKIIAIALICALIGATLGTGATLYFSDRNSAAVTETSEAYEDKSVPEIAELPEKPAASESPAQAPVQDNAAQASESKTEIYESSRQETEIEVISRDTAEELAPADVYRLNVNSTVGITTTIQTNYWGYTSQSAASGSGFIISSDGYILTNYHVIEDSTTVKVTLYNDDTFDAAVIGFDENNDIAVLKITPSYELSPVILGDSDLLNVGDFVVAIGNPLGELTFSMTYGLVSALDREVTLESNITMKLIQTDCAINSGNSGGALFNMYGEVIGITNAKYSSSSSASATIDNIGFAIPVNTIKDIVYGIIEAGYETKPYIGISVTSVGSEAVSYGTPQGAAVASVTEGAPAAAAGLEENDIIVSVNGTTIESSNDLVEFISSCSPGDVLNVHVYRQGEYIDLTITVGETIKSVSAESAEEETTEDYYGQYPSSGQSGGMGGWPFGGFGY